MIIEEKCIYIDLHYIYSKAICLRILNLFKEPVPTRSPLSHYFTRRYKENEGDSKSMELAEQVLNIDCSNTKAAGRAVSTAKWPHSNDKLHLQH